MNVHSFLNTECAHFCRESKQMKKFVGKIEFVGVGREDVLNKDGRDSIEFALDGIVGDRHQSFERDTWDSGDKQPPGVVRRNERHWSALSTEELADISNAMDLSTPLQASTLGANLCISGVPEFSRLYKGSILKFPSGAELVVEEYNPACRDMGEFISGTYTTNDGAAPTPTSFLTAAKLTRGIVGVVEVAGTVSVGDEVEITLYHPPKILLRSEDK